MNKDDRRAKRTDKAFKTALIELMKTKDIKDITINELANQADIHRATFYTHYEDIYDLYNRIENSAIEYISSLLDWEPGHVYKDNFKVFADYIYANTELFGVLLSGQSFFDRLCAIVKERYIDICKNEIHNDTLPDIWLAMSEYHIRGSLSMIAMLVRKNTLPPEDKLIDLIYQLDCHFDLLLDKLKYNKQ